jgi:predicted  nucleic acid-binding Zn-ribbon protein
MNTDLKTQLQHLLELQQIDIQIYDLRRIKEEKPAKIAELEAAFEAKRGALAGLEKAALDLQKQKKDREGELASREESIQKLQGQLYQLKTNKEYHTMQQQIEDAKADKSVIEDKILEFMESIDASRADVEKEKARLTEEEKVFTEGKKALQAEIREIDDKLACLETQRKQATPLIKAEVLAQYDRILKIRGGLAIVPVQGTSCGGCHMFVPPQVINMISMYDTLVTCEMCNRILYLDERSAGT